MATVERQRVKFTGKRTGLASIGIPGIGRLEQGDTVEVSVEQAERWTEPLPMRNGKTGSDFTKQGGVVKVDEDAVGERILKQQDKVHQGEDVDATDVNPDGGTAEEEAELREIPIEAEPSK